jgi:hypothetical protein
VSQVQLSAEVTGPKYSFTARTMDVSVDGAALECELPLEEGDEIRLALFFIYEGIEDERTPPLVVGARVEWTAEADSGAPTAGVKFDRITEAQTKWLANVLAVSDAQQRR